MTSRRSLADDSRAVGRTFLVGLLAVGLVAAVGFLLFGGVLTDGGSEEPTATGGDGSDTEPPADGGDEDSDPDNSSRDDPPSRVDVEVDLWEQAVGDRLLYSSLSLRNASGGVVENKSLTGISSTTFEDLSYDENYTISAKAENWPAKTVEFTASENHEEDVVVGYEFRSADSFGYSAYVNLTELNSEKHETKGLYDNGEAVYYVQFLNDDGSDAAEVEYYVAPDRTTYGLSNTGENELDHPGWGYVDFQANDPVFKGLDQYEERTFVKRIKIGENRRRQFLTERTAGRTLDMYEVNLSSHYSEDDAGNLYNNAVAYVDSQTGYVVRVESDGIVFADGRAGSDWYHNAGHVIYEFYDFEKEIDISRDDMDLEPP
ncbi:hypothetical protein ACFQHN_32565 [Natrialbaceae archaeon GCM10025896]